MRNSLLPVIPVQHYAPTAVITQEKPGLKVLWERVLEVDYYKTTLNALLPIMQLVSNSDLLKINSLKRGHKKVRLSLVDLWEDELLPFPNASQAYHRIAQAGKEPAGVIELSIFAQILNRENILANREDMLVLAMREYNRLGDNIKAFPSLSKEEEHGIMLGMLGLTYDWVMKNHHCLFLVIG